MSGPLPLTYAGMPSTFGGEMKVTKRGLYEVIVFAYDSLTGNTGVDRKTIRVF